MNIYFNKKTGELSHPHGALQEVKKAYWEKFGWEQITDKNGIHKAILVKQNGDEYIYKVVSKREESQVETYESLGYVLVKNFYEKLD